MSTPAVRFSIIACIGLTLALLFAASARSQLDVSPSYVPIGVSSSGNTSTAWFHEPSTRQALACQTVGSASGVTAINCVSTRLP